MQLSFTLVNDATLNVHLVRHYVLKPGVPCRGVDTLKAMTLAEYIVLTVLFRHLTFHITSAVARLRVCL